MPYIAPEDRPLAMFTTVVTNLSLLPPVYHAASLDLFLSTLLRGLANLLLYRGKLGNFWMHGYFSIRKRHWVHFVIFLMTFTTSLFYHFAEVMGTKIFGMNDGSWHRLDTVCSILSFQTLAIYFADVKHRHEEEGVRWALLMIALWCQEKSPWEVEYTIIPIVCGFIFTIGKTLYNNKLPELNSNIRWMVLWGTIALYFFFVGLDDRNDWIRINHGMWHLFAGLAIHYALKSKEHSHTDHHLDSVKSATHKI